MNDDDAGTLSEREFMGEQQALELLELCSNRGRWGADDELGTLNYITEEKRLRALSLPSTGRVVSIGKDLDLIGSSRNPDPVVHRMLYLAHSDPSASIDMTTIAPHGFAVTHMDAVGHTYFEGSIYNGRLASEVVSARGLGFGSIAAAREGVVTRGVLLDVAAARSVRWLEPGQGVWPEDLEAAERHAGVRVESGDAIFVRTGLGAREGEEGPEDIGRRAGLVAECLPWLHEREVAVYSGDCVEMIPQPYGRLEMPLHQIGLSAMGLSMLDVPELEELRSMCEELDRFEFLLVYAPLRLPGGTGSPVNPLCMF